MGKRKIRLAPNRYGVDWDIEVDGEVVLTEVKRQTACAMVKEARKVEREAETKATEKSVP